MKKIEIGGKGIMNYTDIVIVLGSRCNAACDSCCLEADISKQKKLELGVIKRFLESAEGVEQIKTIHFSGGEIFLYYEDFIELVRVCKKIGRRSTAITNAHWATTEEKAYKILCELKKAGLNDIGVSYDEFHSKFIKVDNIRNFIRAAKKAKFKPSIQVILIKGSRNGQWINELGGDLADTLVNFMTCESVGRAAKTINQHEFIREEGVTGKICRKGGTFSVLYDGSVWPCCSPNIFSTEMSIGNINSDIQTVRDALKKLYDDPFLKILRNRGFDYYLKACQRKDILELPQYITSSCELCEILFARGMKETLIPCLKEQIEKESGIK